MSKLDKIINWRRLSDKITTSGQPTEEQFHDIKDLGVSHIINLGPHWNKGALADEEASVTAFGMSYIYIPVDFEDPTEENFAAFCEALNNLEEETIHVHCIYNARVSAFFYRRAKEGRGGNVEDAFLVMDGIWRPGDAWAKFMDNEEVIGQPNLYKGDEY